MKPATKAFLSLFLSTGMAIPAMAQNAGSFLSSGNKKFRENNFKEAIADYTKAIELQPGNIELYERRADAESSIDLYEQAIADYTKAIAIKPDDERIYFARAGAEGAVHQYKQAIADFDKVIAQKPKYACTYNNRGLAKFESGLYAEAINDYTAVLNLDQNHHKIVYVNRADAYASLKQYENAMADYTKAVELDPTNKAYYEHEHISKKDLESNKDLLPAWKKEVIDGPCPNYYRGKFEFDMGMYERALNDMHQAVALFPENKYAYTLRALIDSYIKSAEVTLTDIDKAISIDPNFAWAYINKGEIEKHFGKYDNALADFNQAIAKDTAANSTAYINRGNLYLLTGEYGKAVADLTRGLKNQDADSAAIYNARGYAYHSLNDDKNALADNKAAINIGGKNYQPIYHYTETDKPDEAGQWVQLNFISPVDDVNKLKQGFITLSSHDVVQVKVMLLSNARIKPGDIQIMINDKAVAIGDMLKTSTLAQVKYDTPGLHSYLLKAYIKFPDGKTNISVHYGRHATQQLIINQENVQF